jgi:hypothetical protein
LPTPEEFRRQLRETREQYDPLDALLVLQRELITLESKHGMASEDFYRQYQAGDAGDATELIWWAGRYRQYVQLKTAIRENLDVVVASESVVLPL